MQVKSGAKRFLRIADSIYLLFLGIGIGGIIASGVFAAPIVFNATEFIAPEVAALFDRADSGAIMGNIFLRLNGYLILLLGLIVVYEGISIFAVCDYPKIWLIPAIASVVCIALFAWYYTPFILDRANLDSENFDSMHQQSVLVFKILMISLSVLFVSRAYRHHVLVGEGK